MEDKNNYKQLATIAKDFSLLYIEDNSGLQKQASKIFKKFFPKVFVGQDGEEGLSLYKQHSPDIIVSDIKMPKMNGLEMAKKIKEIDSDARIIITSAFEEKEYLLESIDIGITKYLKKPIPLNELVDALIDVIDKLNEDKDKRLFEHYTKDAFEYQDHILIFIKDDKSLMANKKCLEFFAQENHKIFREFFKNFSKLLLPHENFLYEKDGKNWLETIKEESGKLFNVKLKDSKGKNRHFVLKATKIPDKDGYYILSFDDITELGLLDEENSNLSEEQRKEEDRIKMMSLLHVIKRNKTKVRLYNSYKGLSISNTGTIEEVMSDHIDVKTTYLQQRAVHLEKQTTIESELFPKALECNLENVNFQTQIITLNEFLFAPYLPSMQEHVRVMPESTSEIKVYFHASKLPIKINILDISVDSCNLSFESLPAGLKEKSELLIKVKLGSNTSPLELDIKAQVLKTKEYGHEFRVVTLFELETKKKKLLVDYIAKRQMALIREFKGLENAK